jgi:hypothetical protein
MRRMLGVIVMALGVIAVVVPSAAPVSAALAGHVTFGGYDRDGYEYS